MPAGTLGTDGRWSVSAPLSAPYKTRIVVDRPADPRRFNGTVLVEWVNVSTGVDVGADLGYLHQELLRRGYAYVGVSVQSVGVEALKKWDAPRYGSLVQPGDAYSYDIYSQAAQALRGPASPLRGLRVRQLLGDGESQSAMRMVTYVDAIQPVAHAFDGFLIHSRAATAAPLYATAAPTPSLIRTDSSVPVLQLQSETDLEFPGLSTLGARQPDNPRLRTWEVPGTSHVDGSLDEFSITPLLRDAPTVPPQGCQKSVNNGQEHFVMNTALRALAGWAAGGRPPASAAPVTATGSTIQRDAHGNALGGVRTPALDAPFATYDGIGNGPPGWCSLMGTTTPFDQATLHALYPTHAAYLAKVAVAAGSAVRRGFLLPQDAAQIVADARYSPIGE